MEKVTKYKTRDGKYFLKKKSALEWEAKLDKAEAIAKLLPPVGIPSNSTLAHQHSKAVVDIFFAAILKYLKDNLPPDDDPLGFYAYHFGKDNAATYNLLYMHSNTFPELRSFFDHLKEWKR